MFLFNKKTRNIIKYIWGGFAILIVISMIITYSGFTALPRTPSVSNGTTTTEQQVEVPPEIQAQLQNRKDGEPIELTDGESSYEKEQVLKAIEEGRLNIDPNATGTPATQEGTPKPPTQELKLEI